MTSSEGVAADELACPSGLANASLIFAGVCFALSCLTILGAVPVVIMVAGFILSARSGEVNTAIYTTRISQAMIVLFGIILFGYAASLREAGSGVFIASLSILGSASLLELIWLAPIKRNVPAWRQSRERKRARTGNPSGGRIIGRDAMSTYSVADELIKWNKLREDGLVTDAQFEEARAKLLAGH